MSDLIPHQSGGLDFEVGGVYVLRVGGASCCRDSRVRGNCGVGWALSRFLVGGASSCYGDVMILPLTNGIRILLLCHVGGATNTTIRCSWWKWTSIGT